MIARITLENFFSFGRSTDIYLNDDINLLVGINGSGKSNLLKAIKLLYEGVIGEGFEKIFLKDWSGFNSVANFQESQAEYIRLEFEFSKSAINRIVGNRGFRFSKNPIYEIVIYRSGNTSYFLKERIYSEDAKGRDKDFLYLEIENTKGVISTRENNSIKFQAYPHKGRQISFKSTELVLSQISDPDRFYPLFTLKRALEDCAVYEYFDTTLTSLIRQPGSYDIEDRLLSNGQNLMSTIIRIKNQHSLEYEKIEHAISKINPNFKDINFDILGSKLFLVLREKFLSKSVSIEHISDGTLRYLILLSIFFNPKRGGIVCIDEPEISLHPDMINSIAEFMRFSSQNGSQIIVATHSPLLLNSFELDEVHIFEKDITNQTTVTVKTEEDFEKWNDKFLVGQLWLRGQIGGKRW